MKHWIGIVFVVGILAALALFAGSALIDSSKPRSDTVSREQMNEWQNAAAWYQSQTKQLEQNNAVAVEKAHALELQL